MFIALLEFFKESDFHSKNNKEDNPLGELFYKKRFSLERNTLKNIPQDERKKIDYIDELLLRSIVWIFGPDAKVDQSIKERFPSVEYFTPTVMFSIETLLIEIISPVLDKIEID